LEQATPKKRSGRYVVEIRDAAGASLLLTGADWTDTERDLATLGSIWDVWQARGDHGAMSKQRSRPETSSTAHLRSCYEKLDCANLAGLPVSIGSRNWRIAISAVLTARIRPSWALKLVDLLGVSSCVRF
jgi:hypothetical protein